MLDKVIKYFASRQMLANFILIGAFLGAIVAWQNTGKEEMPNYELNFINIRTSYPGAAPEDVEQLVTKRLEKKLKGIDGIYNLRSTSSLGSSMIMLEFVPGYDEMDEALNDIRNQVQAVRLPAEVRDPPMVRQFKTSRRSVLDVAIFLTNRHTLDRGDRGVLQKLAYNLSDQIESLQEVSEVSRSGYYKYELQILLDAAKLKAYNISASDVIATLRRHNFRTPAGKLDDTEDTKVSVIAELDTATKLSNLIIRASFDSPAILLSDLGTVRNGFTKHNSIYKVNGYEAVILNVRKTTSSDILSTTDAVREFVERYRASVLNETPAEIQLLSDGSTGVRHRLDLIFGNGIFGLILILVFLFLFMDSNSALWVAMGIPFTFCVTMIAFPLMGYSINNITLAAIIIVMGMIVDNAIVISENIDRHHSSGLELEKAILKGTREMVMPVFGSITTTCVAFIPLFFFSGRFSQMLVFIPPVVVVMLLASFFESIFILPAHLGIRIANRVKTWFIRLRSGRSDLQVKTKKRHWFVKVEAWYARVLYRLLRFRYLILLFFLGLLVSAGLIFATKFNYVLFPEEETKDLNISGYASDNLTKEETEVAVRAVEAMVELEKPDNVIGYRTVIAQSRRGGTATQSSFSISIELKESEDRPLSTGELLRKWRAEIERIPGIPFATVSAGRFGSGSGSAIEVEVRENNDEIRQEASEAVAYALARVPGLRNSEVNEPVRNPEYRININRELVTRLGVNPSDLASSMRTVLEGTIVDEINTGDEEVDIRVTLDGHYKHELSLLLGNPVQGMGDYLIPINRLVSWDRVLAPSAITRIHHKRVTQVYADLDDGNEPVAKRRSNKPIMPGEEPGKRPLIELDDDELPVKNLTPIEVAEWLEKSVFPKIQKIHPGVVFSFSGEIKDTRESSGDIFTATILVLFLIFVTLAMTFDSISRPIIVMLAIPFGLVGVIFIFWAHGISEFGLFAAIGALGLAGVVVNDSIVMINKLDRSLDEKDLGKNWLKKIAKVSSTRLRAVMLTTLTTVAGLIPTAYGVLGYDAMLAQMMLALSWGLIFGTLITLILIPTIYTFIRPKASKDAKRGSQAVKPNWRQV